MSSVDTTRPPITAIAIGERNSPPAPTANAAGNMPAAIASVVMMMGRERLMPASMIAVVRSTPFSIASIAKSTSMIAFLVTMPSSISSPIATGRLSELPVMRRATTAPPIESGSENRMVTGCRKLWNRSTSTA